MVTVTELWEEWKPYHEQLSKLNLGDYRAALENIQQGSIDHSKIDSLKKLEEELQRTFGIAEHYRQISKQRPKLGTVLQKFRDRVAAEQPVNPVDVLRDNLKADGTVIESIVSLEDEIAAVRDHLNARVSSDFNTAYSSLEDIAQTRDIGLLSQRRTAVDNTYLLCVDLNGDRLPKQFKKYRHLYGQRPVIMGGLKRLQDTYKEGKWKQADIPVLENMVADSQRFARQLGKIRFYEGVIEAKQLQQQINARISALQKPVLQPAQKAPVTYTTPQPKPAPPITQPKPQPVYVATPKQEPEPVADFVLSHYLSQLERPRTFQVSRLGPILTDSYENDTWYARLYQFVEALKSIGKVKDQRDAKYLQNLAQGLQLASSNGLGEELADSEKFRTKYNEALSLLKQYSTGLFRQEFALAF